MERKPGVARIGPGAWGWAKDIPRLSDLPKTGEAETGIVHPNLIDIAENSVPSVGKVDIVKPQ